ncbi:MAG: hypothetical protein JWN64_702 [Parcubacteria group bacterium]|nr:hypothetical protein [Parcubacteria group bacterium]
MVLCKRPNMNVTQISRNWNPLVSELNSWLVFGRSLERELELV